MSPFWVSVVLAAVAIVSAVAFSALGGIDGPGANFVLGLVVLGCGITAIIIPPVIYGSRHFGRVSCHTFAEQTGRQTRFVLYNSWATGDCLTPTADGKWISTSMLREFGEAP